MIRYEPMNESHVVQVAKLETVCFSDPWSENSVASELKNSLSLWLVALDGERVAGYVGSQAVMGEADMMNIAVDPDYRRQGVAENLVNHLVKVLAQKGNHSLALEVRQSNQAAISLYQKLGFSQVGFRPGYYRNPKEGALILRKEWEL
jgi:ribosomal-protein-alanine N-acetyltransferase